MTRRYTLTKSAKQDLDEVFDFGADTFGVAQAAKHLREIQQRIELLAKFPEMGQLREDLFHLLPEIRAVAVTPEVIYYRAEADGVTILRIVRGERDIESVLKAWLQAEE